MVVAAHGRMLRFIAIGGSIASDLNNPIATSSRAVLSEIARAGHDVTFLEMRGNPALANVLTKRGARPFKAFTDRYPEIRFRTYDLTRGWERTVWFGREIGTADAIIALPDTPGELLPEISSLHAPRLVRLVDESLHVGRAEFRLVRATDRVPETELMYGPAVSVSLDTSGERSARPLLVAYDDAGKAFEWAAEMSERDPMLIVTGSADLPGWTYVPEVELPDLYRRHSWAVVTGAGSSSWSQAREFLPRAWGCASVDDPAGLPPERIPRSATSVPRSLDAAIQAGSIIAAVAARLAR